VIRVNRNTVELTEAEGVIAEGVTRLLDRGYCHECAVKLILGVDIPPNLRSPAPMTEALLVGPFLDWLLADTTGGDAPCHTPQ
jgi:hypothetical protein